jgi:hypothetical protein
MDRVYGKVLQDNEGRLRRGHRALRNTQMRRMTYGLLSKQSPDASCRKAASDDSVGVVDQDGRQSSSVSAISNYWPSSQRKKLVKVVSRYMRRSNKFFIYNKFLDLHE